MEHLDPDQLVLIALGERTTPSGAHHEHFETGSDNSEESVRVHLQECSVCRRELTQLTRTVELAREAGELGLQTPVVLPASLWSGIAKELGIGTPPAARSDPRTVPRPLVTDGPDAAAAVSAGVTGLPDAAADRGPAESAVTAAAGPTRSLPGSSRVGAPPRPLAWRRGLLVAAAVVAIAASVGTGVLLGRPDSAPVVAVQSEADLMPMPSGPPTAHGTATITQTATGLTLRVAARQLPLRQGYYEVWLYNPTADKMVAVGTLGAAGDGAWSLASTIDLRSYSIVNVSAQDFDGNPAHKDSVLQGPLTQ